MDIKTIGVVGAGQMGNGIAQVAANFGFNVIMLDVSGAALEKGIATIAGSCDRLIKKNAMSEADKTALLGRIKTAQETAALKDCDIVIEAATENIDLKLKIFKDLDANVKPEALLVSNTSSISITKIAGVTKRPDKVAGMHFMNPVPLMKLVEGIRGLQTSDETFATVKALSEKMDKVFVESVKDMPGFIVNRVLMPMINEAVYTLHEGIASVESIDAAMKLGTNQPMGPLTLADFIGLDTCLAIMNVLHDGLGDSKYRPCPLLVKYVEAGWLGRKTGRGFYNYAAK
ncbi:3-hydroxybutyryl-CoA dehydrogenase [Bdellovibrio reynosensis]|uniref:3-hydroxybutyryl-CoA dehydrogenase n=1 Tax=Bdellovibrio reynosensis TaxID=2835041 RepID=A0ABY4CBN1_9BACT|nr:3-hydroxybutyryl-CoA dehydrogenase [Bdellovibrio reynosensis]UOF02124.1 3-hydroxybutyryl-CoA dehydrogenase [Bdellovibrio reynosensis]